MRRSKLKGLTGILLMAISIGAMYIWLTYGSEALASREVLVAKVDIPKGTVIEPEKHFIVEKRHVETLISDALTSEDIRLLSGMAAKHYIPKNAQINSNFFTQADFVVTQDQVVFKVPPDWIYVVPSSIRRGDNVQFLELEIYSDQMIPPPDMTASKAIQTFLEIPAERLAQAKPVLTATVLYVKDSSNREVVDVGEGERMDGSSQIGSIEIACTNDEIRTLEKSVEKGMKFIVVYNPR